MMISRKLLENIKMMFRDINKELEKIINDQKVGENKRRF